MLATPALYAGAGAVAEQALSCQVLPLSGGVLLSSQQPSAHPPKCALCARFAAALLQCAGWRVAKNAEGADCITHEWKVRNFRAGLDLFQRCACACVGVSFSATAQLPQVMHTVQFGTVNAGCGSSGPNACMPTSLLTPLRFSAAAAPAACRIAVIAEEEGHHPDLHLTGFNTVTAEMTTHAAKGLTENDFIMATKVGGRDVRCGGEYIWGKRWVCWCVVAPAWSPAAAPAASLSPFSFPPLCSPPPPLPSSLQINELEISDLLPKRKPKYWA